MEKKNYNPIQEAYNILVEVYNNPDADEQDLSIAIEEAIGYLGEVLDN